MTRISSSSMEVHEKIYGASDPVLGREVGKFDEQSLFESPKGLGVVVSKEPLAFNLFL